MSNSWGSMWTAACTQRRGASRPSGVATETALGPRDVVEGGRRHSPRRDSGCLTPASGPVLPGERVALFYERARAHPALQRGWGPRQSPWGNAVPAIRCKTLSRSPNRKGQGLHHVRGGSARAGSDPNRRLVPSSPASRRQAQTGAHTGGTFLPRLEAAASVKTVLSAKAGQDGAAPARTAGAERGAEAGGRGREGPAPPGLPWKAGRPPSPPCGGAFRQSGGRAVSRSRLPGKLRTHRAEASRRQLSKRPLTSALEDHFRFN